MLEKMCQIRWQRKFGDSTLQNASTRENARACACARFFAKCLKWPETYAKLIWNEFEHFKILMRAYVRVEVRARILLTFLVDLWPEVDVYRIWFIFYYSLSRYDNDLIFTKWRLDDVTMTPWTWKSKFDLKS